MIDRFVESMKPRASHEESYIKALSHAILDSVGLGFHPTKSSTSNPHLPPSRFGRPINICTHQNCSTAARASVRSRSCFPFFPPHSPFLRMRKSAGLQRRKVIIQTKKRSDALRLLIGDGEFRVLDRSTPATQFATNTTLSSELFPAKERAIRQRQYRRLARNRPSVGPVHEQHPTYGDRCGRQWSRDSLCETFYVPS